MRMAIVCLAVALVAMVSASFAEERVKKSDLPAVVQKAADAQSAGARILGYSKDKQHGRVEYEVELMVGDHTKDVTIDPQGRVLEIEEQVATDELPADVFHGLSAQAGKGEIAKVESLTKDGRVVAYEAEVVGGKHAEIRVGPDGQKLVHEE